MRFEDYVCFWGDVVVAHGADDVGGAMLRGGILVFFPVCLGFSLIVMYDATGVRRHSGMQAEVAWLQPNPPLLQKLARRNFWAR
ncbi:hypothetical protein CK203_045705 [Vitis vinifera]|uniref:Uncharacterized protein n=1 Tax=Vitis vinifera TaxID=29760 RepID=A0A438I0X9_VITVI|nr:hypothetical protein CK203_045705 [Vitis vinifera]